MQMQLKILSPNSVMLDKFVDSVVLKLETGDMGVFPGHVPIAGKIKRSEVKYKVNNIENSMEVDEGYTFVMPNRVMVFTK